MSVPIQIIGGAFEDPQGTRLANGSLVLELNQDAQVNGNTQLCGGLKITVPLDVNGDIQTSIPVFVWPNDVMSPSNTYYTVTGYSQIGQLAWGPNTQQILSSPDPFNVGLWVPNQLFYWNPSIANIIAGVVTVIFSSTPVFNVGFFIFPTFQITLSGNVTGSTLVGASPGDIITFKIIQDGTGGHTFVWPVNVHNAGVVNPAANSVSTQSFVFDGLNAYPIGVIMWS